MPHHYQRSIWACCLFHSHSLLLEPELIGQWSISGINGWDSMRFWELREKSSMRKSRETQRRCREIFDDSRKLARSDRKCSWLAVQLAISIEVNARREKRDDDDDWQKRNTENKRTSMRKKSAGQQENIMVNLLMRGCGYPERSAVHIMKCMAKWIHYKIICSDEKREVL